MESNFWTLPEGQKRMLVAQTSERVGLPPQAVEKDWWVTMTLKALFESSCRDFITFKGGTSLSKGWHVIERFSEDVDIAIDKSFWGIAGDNKSQRDRIRNFRGPISGRTSLQKCGHCWRDTELWILSCALSRHRILMQTRHWFFCLIGVFMRISIMWSRKSESNSVVDRCKNLVRGLIFVR